MQDTDHRDRVGATSHVFLIKSLRIFIPPQAVCDGAAAHGQRVQPGARPGPPRGARHQQLQGRLFGPLFSGIFDNFFLPLLTFFFAVLIPGAGAVHEDRGEAAEG